MPKLIVVLSEAKPKDRKAATSPQNVKALIEKRIAKDATDTKYKVITINQKMGLKPVVAFINTPASKLEEAEGVLNVESWEIDPSKAKRGRWTIEGTAVKKKPAPTKEEKKAKKEKASEDDKAEKSEKKKSKKDKGEKKAKKNKKAKKD